MGKSIMKNDTLWKNYRFKGSHEHHVFGGSNRKHSDEDGLVIYLTPEMHNMSSNGIHFNKDFDLYAKRKAEERWLEYYNKTIDDFIKRYHCNYL